MSAPTAKAWMTRQEVADYLQVPVKTLAQWATRGKGPRFRKIGRYARYSQADLMSWESRQVVGGGTQDSGAEVRALAQVAAEREMRTTPELIARNIARIRKVRGWSVREFSKILGETFGYPMLHSAISNVENGKRSVSAEELLIFASALNVTVADLLQIRASEQVVVSRGRIWFSIDKFYEWLSAAPVEPID